jgi:hypothetical protein
MSNRRERGISSTIRGNRHCEYRLAFDCGAEVDTADALTGSMLLGHVGGAA